MRVKIKYKPNQKIPLYILIPNGLFLNPITALFLPKAVADSGIELTPAQARLLVKSLKCTIRECKRKFPGLQLVEAESSSGESVKIKL